MATGSEVMMKTWIKNRLLDLAFYCPIEFFAYVLVELQANIANHGPPMRCVRVTKRLDYELKYDKTYVKETERTVDEVITKLRSSRS